MGAPLHFEKHIVDISADTMGEIDAKIYYTKKGNNAGNAFVYLIHKNGGKWWVQESKKRFPYIQYSIDRRIFKATRKAAKLLVLEDTTLLKDFNKWAFFVDKQYLRGKKSAGDDFIQVNEKGEYYLPSEAEIKKMEEVLTYYNKPDTTIEVVLYEQKAGSNVWTAIDKKKFKTDADGDAIEPIDPKTGKESCWECDFMRQKVKESNIPVQKN